MKIPRSISMVITYKGSVHNEPLHAFTAPETRNKQKNVRNTVEVNAQGQQILSSIHQSKSIDICGSVVDCGIGMLL
jgi:hypothetical protein